MTIYSFIDALNIINNKLKDNSCLLIGIDGRCGSGKTTFAAFLKERLSCNVFHVDDYFLRPTQRTEERINTPGGNFDIERFNSEIAAGIISGKDFSYSPFDCSKMEISSPITVKNSTINIVEGSYSCHPEIALSYDITFFITVSEEKQKERIILRNKDKADMFFSKWIPLEEKYFSAFDIQNKCDYTIEQ